jgi:hypothetical protein
MCLRPRRVFFAADYTVLFSSFTFSFVSGSIVFSFMHALTPSTSSFPISIPVATAAHCAQCWVLSIAPVLARALTIPVPRLTQGRGSPEINIFEAERGQRPNSDGCNRR